MIQTPTVLILGAGASVHLGYPLGRSLISQLCTPPRPPEEEVFGKWSQSDVTEFKRRLSRAGHYSIDAFLEENPKQLELGRFLIARELKKHEDTNHLFPPHNSGWYQLLFNKLIDNGPDKIGDNALSIVTFNYDRSLECYIHEALQARFDLSAEDAAERLSKIRIIHPHGILGSFPQTPYRADVSVDELVRISKNIKIIHELEDSPSGFCSPEFQIANDCLNQAQRILFLGFGFHTANVRRFKFFTAAALEAREVMATAAGLGTADMEALTSRLAEFGFTRTMFSPGHECDGFFSHRCQLH